MSTMPAPLPSPADPSDRSSGGCLVTADGRSLPFRGGTLSADAKGGLCRVVLRQRFINPGREPLRVVYQAPLPVHAAVSGYAFELGEERIVGEVDLRLRARERFEEALVEGRTAALLEQDRSSLFTQELGNVPGGAEIVCELVLDLRLDWEGGAGWTLRFPTVVAPRYAGGEGRVPDAAHVAVDVLDSGSPARMRLELVVRDALTGPVHSPSHALSVRPGAWTEVGLAANGGAALDRDLVIRWPVAGPGPGLVLDLARATADRPVAGHACGLLTLVPPALPATAVPRDLVILLDTSGSMGGAPLTQAQAVSCALVESLGTADRLELIEFSSRPRAWQRGPLAATEAHKAQAIAWIRALRAGGGTEMRDGVLAALATLRGEAQRQVVLITDGLISFEHEIVSAVATRLPRGCRVHTLGIGGGVNRSLLSPVARAGGGVEAIVGLGEDPAAAAAALVAATAAPQVVDLELSGEALVEVAHHHPPDLLAGQPLRLALRLRPEGGVLVVRGHTAAGPWEQRVMVPATAAGEGSPGLVALVGRELAEELELQAALGKAVETELERLGLDYQVANRLCSWVAVSRQRTVDPSAPTRRERVPQELPHGMSVAGLGLRSPSPVAFDGGMVSEAAPRSRAPMMVSRPAPASPPPELDALSAPSAQSSKRARAKGGLVDTLRQALTGRGGRRDQEREEAKAMAPSVEAGPVVAGPAVAGPAVAGPAVAGPAVAGPAGPAAPRNLVGRLVLARPDRLVIEVDLGSEALDWQPAGPVSLRLADGRTLLVRVDPVASTRGGRVAAGTTLRLVVLLGKEGGLAPVDLEIPLANGERLHVTLSPVAP